MRGLFDASAAVIVFTAGSDKLSAPSLALSSRQFSNPGLSFTARIPSTHYSISLSAIAAPSKITSSQNASTKYAYACLTESRLTPMKTVIAATIMLAHSWYPGACCHDQDCHPVPCDSIRADGLGLSWDEWYLPMI